MSSVIDSIERGQLRKGLPSFDPGDRVRVHFQVVEGNRRRTQVFEGIVLRRQGSGARETFTVRKQSFGVGVERTFPLHSPKIEKLEIAARGAVRRAKLYYLRGRIGKAARVAERRWGIDEELISAPAVTDEPSAVDAEGATIAEAEAEEPSADAAAAGPVAAGDPPPPAVAKASSGAVPPAAPPAEEIAEEHAQDDEPAAEAETDAEVPEAEADAETEAKAPADESEAEPSADEDSA